MKVYASLAFEIAKEERLAPLVIEKGWSRPTDADPESFKAFEGARAVLRRDVHPAGDSAIFAIVGPTLTDISIAYAGIICDLEDVGLLPKNS